MKYYAKASVDDALFGVANKPANINGSLGSMRNFTQYSIAILYT